MNIELNIENREKIEKLFRRLLTDEQASRVFIYLICRLAKLASTTEPEYLDAMAGIFRQELSKHSLPVVESAQVDGPVASKQSR